MNGNLNSIIYVQTVFSFHTISNSYRQIWESNSIVECINYLEHASHAILTFYFIAVCCFGWNFADANRCRDVEIWKTTRVDATRLAAFPFATINYCWTCTHDEWIQLFKKRTWRQIDYENELFCWSLIVCCEMWIELKLGAIVYCTCIFGN